MDELDQRVRMSTVPRPAVDQTENQFEHEQMHRTIDELIEQAAMKARDAVSQATSLTYFFFRRSIL